MIESAAGLIGRRPMHLGRGPTYYDCAGAVSALYAAVGITCPLPDGYSLHWYMTQPGKMRAYIEDQLRWPKPDDIEAGDLLLFRCATREGDHPGVYLGEGHMFHSVARGTEIRALREQWLARLVCVYRPPVPSEPCPQQQAKSVEAQPAEPSVG